MSSPRFRAIDDRARPPAFPRPLKNLISRTAMTGPVGVADAPVIVIGIGLELPSVKS